MWIQPMLTRETDTLQRQGFYIGVCTHWAELTGDGGRTENYAVTLAGGPRFQDAHSHCWSMDQPQVCVRRGFHENSAELKNSAKYCAFQTVLIICFNVFFPWTSDTWESRLWT